LENAKKTRSDHTLAAAMQDANAVAEIKHARSAEAAAAATLADLSVAIPAAREKLADVERDAAAARSAVAKLISEQTMRKRIGVAGKIDSAIADLTKLLVEFEGLARKLLTPW
jgi:hypothetical protein